jgi:hypothetical protein
MTSLSAANIIRKRSSSLKLLKYMFPLESHCAICELLPLYAIGAS